VNLLFLSIATFVKPHRQVNVILKFASERDLTQREYTILRT